MIYLLLEYYDKNLTNASAVEVEANHKLSGSHESQG